MTALAWRVRRRSAGPRLAVELTAQRLHVRTRQEVTLGQVAEMGLDGRAARVRVEPDDQLGLLRQHRQDGAEGKPGKRVVLAHGVVGHRLNLLWSLGPYGIGLAIRRRLVNPVATQIAAHEAR